MWLINGAAPNNVGFHFPNPTDSEVQNLYGAVGAGDVCRLYRGTARHGGVSTVRCNCRTERVAQEVTAEFNRVYFTNNLHAHVSRTWLDNARAKFTTSVLHAHFACSR